MMQDNTHYHEWLEHQAEQAIYAIVDPHSEHAPHHAFFQCGGENGGPLLSAQQLTNPEDGPWLLPANREFLQWWAQEQHAQSGILIAAPAAELNHVRAHFSSLFQAILLGELIFFPFYRPNYLGPMLPRLYPEERTALLAGYAALLYCNHEWQHYPSTIRTTSPTQNTPWWVIQEHHLDNTPNLPLLASNVESWLWQHQPALMQVRIETNQDDFKAQFEHQFLTLDSDTMTLTSQVVTATVLTILGSISVSPELSEAITDTQDDELLFALKHTFSLLQGHA